MDPLTVAAQSTVIDIGGMPARINSSSEEFLQMLEERYSGFVNLSAAAAFELDVKIVPPRRINDEEDLSVRFSSGTWQIERGDFHATWDDDSRHGTVVQSANPYSIDTALRIIHSLILAREGGLLVHAASAVRNGKAFLFSGVSGAGKTTISSLAPPDALLLTDEISYLRRSERGYTAHGTPFAGELAKLGEKIHAPLAAIYFLHKGADNVIEPIGATEAARLLLENVLFFAQDPDLVSMVFATACELVKSVPVYKLTFFPDARVWELIQ